MIDYWKGNLLLLCSVIGINISNGQDNDYNTCSFNYWKMDWHSALRTCEKSGGKRLLCYSTKKEIDDITEAFRLAAYMNAELEMWLSSRNCSHENRTEACLSLHIRKYGQKLWHYFQEDCNKQFPFVCCVSNRGGVTETTVETTAITTVPITDTKTATSSSVTSSVLTSTARTVVCKGKKRRGITWPDTPAGTTSLEPCPGSSIGTAKWFCGQGGRWSIQGPNFRDCRSIDILKWREKFNQSTLQESLSQLEEMLGDRQDGMFGDDLTDVVLTMASFPDHLMSAASLEKGEERWNTIRAMVQRTTGVFDTIMAMDDSWQDIEEIKRPSIGSSLLTTVDGMGLVLADAMVDGVDIESINRANFALQVVRSSSGAPLLLPQWTIPPEHSLKGDILLEEGYDSNIDLNRGKVSVVFALYNNLSSVLESATYSNQSHPSATLNSAVVSAVVSQNNQRVPVSSPVRILVQHIHADPNDTACVFWNLKSHEWDTAGCHLESGNGTFSVCACDHLTNFAVLMDYRGNLDELDQRPFFYITVIGCSISIVCLAVCVAVFSCYSYHSRHSWGLRYIIHRNLCLNLLIANFVLVLGLDQTGNTSLCAVVAGMLHYFFLSSFSWMLLEGVHIYLLLVVVFAARRSHWEKFYLFGYGFPLVVVTITAVARPTYYGTDEVCWLSVEKGTIWAFMGPVAFILLANTAALLLAQWKASNVSAKDDNIVLVKRWLRVTFILFPVLGITWVFGFMYVGKHFEVVGYLFAALNSLQGFCIFVCHCLMDKKARNMVLASFKKKTASVTTGSSGTGQKKSPKDGSSGAKIENGSANNVANANDVTFSNSSSKKWTKCHKPWSFCFDMPVTEDRPKREDGKSLPKPVMARWDIERDRAA